VQLRVGSVQSLGAVQPDDAHTIKALNEEDGGNIAHSE
jgi:hypothetical protein